MGGSRIIDRENKGIPIYNDEIGYIQHVNMNRLQELAESLEVIITLNCLPGTFVTPDRAIAYIVSSKKDISFHDKEKIKPELALRYSFVSQ